MRHPINIVIATDKFKGSLTAQEASVSISNGLKRGVSSVLSLDEIKILQKLVKQRKDSAAIFSEQNRLDLADPEIAQAKIIEQFLPEQLSVEEVEAVVASIIENGSFSGMGAMGQVMGLASKELAGKIDGKTISTVVKALLSK